MKLIPLSLSGAFILHPPKFGDHRGYFSEVYNATRLADLGFNEIFVQDNHSYSSQRGVIRGLHFQLPPFAQGKLVRVIRGAILDVLVDIRQSSATFGQHLTVEISADAWNQVYIPVGFAHGFCTLTDETEVLYKTTAPYDAASDRGLAYDDPALGIEWPVAPDQAILSDKDRKHPKLVDLPDGFA